MVEAIMGYDHKSPEYAALRAFYWAGFATSDPPNLA